MILSFMKTDALAMLITDIPDNISYYYSGEKWIEEYFNGKGINKYYFNSQIEVPDIDLKNGGPKSDYENATIIYDAMKDVLTPIQASDLRLWAFLAHDVFWSYMTERWSIDTPDEGEEQNNKLTDRVGARYFFKESKGKAFVRQGIARLYWSAYLTYDSSNSNPYEYTEYFLSKQDIFTSSTERVLARNKTLLIAALKVLKRAGDLKREQIRRFFLNLNQIGGIIVLDSLSPLAAEELSQRTLDEILCNSSSVCQEVLDKEIESKDEKLFPIIGATEVKRVAENSKLVVKNIKTEKPMLIVVAKNKFQTKPELIGLTIGNIFKIRKESWKITEIK